MCQTLTLCQRQITMYKSKLNESQNTLLNNFGSVWSGIWKNLPNGERQLKHYKKNKYSIKNYKWENLPKQK